MNSVLKREEKAILTLRELYRQYGYTPYKMSRFEEYDLYVRNKDFLVSDQIITFSSDRGRLMALKPDVTLSIVKNAPEQPGVVQKVYYNENVYRDYREIMQAGLECVGDLGEYEIGEVVCLAEESMKRLGKNYVLDLSHMGLISAVLDSCGLEGNRKKQAMICLRRKNVHELRQLCRDDMAWNKLEALLNCRELEALRPLLTTRQEIQAFEELEMLWKLLPPDNGRIRLDFSVGSNLGYYSGVVFRGYLEGIPSSILSGGQYDKLPQKMGRKARAIGFAVYLDLLQELQQEEPGFDVDTVILHDGNADTRQLTAAAREAAGRGTVLVTRTLPRDRSWKTLVRLGEGGQEA